MKTKNFKKVEDYFPPDWKDIIYEMSSRGCSESEIEAYFMTINGLSAAAVDKAVARLRERDLEFRQTLNNAKRLCQAWWEKSGREKITHNKHVIFEMGLWISNMKNRFGWRDNINLEHSMPDNLVEKFASVPTGELIKKIDELLGKPKN